MKTILLALMALVCFSFVAAAAGVDGKWTADVPGRNGTQTNTFTFKSSGDKLEGTVTNQRGDSPHKRWQGERRQHLFQPDADFGGNDIKINYKGVVKGDSIELTREVEGRGGPVTFTAKKAN